MENLEQLEKDLKNAKTIKSYLLSKISYYDFLMYNEKQKIIKEKLDKIKTAHIIEMFKYYHEMRDVYVNILNDLEEKGIRIYE